MPWRWIRMNYEVYHIPTNFTDAGRVIWIYVNWRY